MEGDPRILVASPLGRIVVPQLVGVFPDGMVRVAVDRDAVHRAVTQRVRFDVVIADLVWNKPELEFNFDGLDVVDVLVDRVFLGDCQLRYLVGGAPSRPPSTRVANARRPEPGGPRSVEA